MILILDEDEDGSVNSLQPIRSIMNNIILRRIEHMCRITQTTRVPIIWVVLGLGSMGWVVNDEGLFWWFYVEGGCSGWAWYDRAAVLGEVEGGDCWDYGCHGFMHSVSMDIGAAFGIVAIVAKVSLSLGQT